MLNCYWKKEFKRFNLSRFLLGGLLVLVSQLSVFGQSLPDCTTLFSPQNNAVDVSVNTNIQWVAIPNITQYFLSIGTSAGASDVVDRISLNGSTIYTPTSTLDPNTTYYVRIVPSNNVGDARNCIEEQFTTGVASSIPACATLLNPGFRANGVPPDSEIRWAEQPQAAGYRLTIGTSTGGNDVLDNLDVGNVTTYNPVNGLPLAQTIYVTITPYNSQGESPQCSEQSFRTRGNSPPACTEIIDPMNGAEFVPVTANITWIREFNASGYLMTIEKSSIGGTKILDDFDVGGGTNFKPPDFEANTVYYVTLTPYNDLGRAPDCEPIVFTTGDGPEAPDCTLLTNPIPGTDNVPLNTNLEWAAVDDILGYILTVGTSPGGTELVDSLDVGINTFYDFDENLEEAKTIYVTISPYDQNQIADNCLQQTFTTFGSIVSADDIPVPPFFTPNNDGFNDLWVVESTSNIEVTAVYIFNRYGQLIKQLFPSQGWDGTFNGKPMASDSYWYKIATANAGTKAGFFALKR
ncbi:T9SS type B sorting domain-containing protein [Eudoraea chungangensis]|uniref:T9SS type B sorting domain-containing protein n=1 Tax=Eudoraea chungangensis TaxID=1481905 RepID=UPI0023EC1B4D|nr:T9SS type B sorting domain-containing protein [Eudoraea chungangensis]